MEFFFSFTPSSFIRIAILNPLLQVLKLKCIYSVIKKKVMHFKSSKNEILLHYLNSMKIKSKSEKKKKTEFELQHRLIEQGGQSHLNLNWCYHLHFLEKNHPIHHHRVE